MRTHYGTKWKPEYRDIDLGFLTDDKLLNTALTHARAFVGVVGDPVGLCTIGQCQMIWHEFLKWCDRRENCQLRSEGGLRQIHAEIAEFNMQRKSHSENKYNHSEEERELNSDTEIDDSTDEECSGDDDLNTSFIEEANKYDIDIMLQYLAHQSNADQISNTNDSIQHDEHIDTFMKRRFLDFEEEANFASITSTADNMPKAIRNRKLMSADDYDGNTTGEDESDEDILENEEKDRLLDLLCSQPNNFKRCTMIIKDIKHVYAKVCESNSQYKEIYIASHKDRGTSFDKDEVVVEILEGTSDGEGRPKGKVLGILKSHKNMKYRNIVCMADPVNPSVMIPRMKGMPKIHNLVSGDRGKEMARKGYVQVYRMTNRKKVVHQKFIPLDYENAETQMFLVIYLQWKKTFVSPLGIVIKELPSGSGREKGMAILEVEYDVPKRYNDQSLMIKELKQREYCIPKEILAERTDLRNSRTFTIDKAESQDLDDALSLEINRDEDNQYLVGIHIADVSHFVECGTQLDHEAYKRATSFYPTNAEPVHMLPTCLSTSDCSLLPGKERLTLTVIFCVTGDGHIIEIDGPKEAVIRSQNKLSTVEVEDVLNTRPENITNSHNISLNDQLRLLYKIACGLKQQRVGKDGFLDCTRNTVMEETPKTSLLIEEFMVLTNKTIAEYVLRAFPLYTPLRKQEEPARNDLEKWKDDHGQHCFNTFALHMACKVTCPNFDKIQDNIMLLATQWNQLMQATDIDTIHKIIGNAMLHPQQARALISWFKVQERAIYVRSGNKANYGHSTLQIAAYTHFTSPIRRYIDIVVHRLVKAHIRGTSCPYSAAKLDKICAHCTAISQEASKYEKETDSFQLAVLLKSHPQVMQPVVDQIDSKEIQLLFPMLPPIPSVCRRILYGSLELANQPQVNENNKVHLSWSKRVYDMTYNKQTHASTADTTDEDQQFIRQTACVGSIKSEPFIISVPAHEWQELMQTVRDDDMPKALNCLQQMKQSSQPKPKPTSDILTEMLTENQGEMYREHCCKFQMHVELSQAIEVQLATSIQRGLLTPKVQLLNISSTFSVCLEHRESPLVCFSQNNSNPLKEEPDDISTYITQWLDALVMESAYCSVEENEGAIIHNICIKWQQCEEGIVHGCFKLSKEECKRRYLIFSHEVIELSKGKSVKHDWMEEYHHSLRHGECAQQKVAQYGFLCVRVKRPHKTYGEMACWVGHCHISEVDVGEQHVSVMFKVHQSAVQFPDSLLEQSEDISLPCTVEWINKPLPDK